MLSFRVRWRPLFINLSAQLDPKLRFGNTLVVETLFRLSNRNRVPLQPCSKIEILEQVCGFYALIFPYFEKNLKLTPMAVA